MRRLFALLVLPSLTWGCAGAQAATPRTEAALPKAAETRSLFGEPLYPPVLPPEIRREREVLHSQAEVAWQIRPGSTDTQLSLIRRLMDLGRFREAMSRIEEGEKSFPTSPNFPRLRAEAELALRQFDRVPASVDRSLRLFANAPNSVERTTTVNPRGQTVVMVRANLQSYLGLALFGAGDLEGAAAAFRDQQLIARDPDADAAARLWRYLTLLTAGKGKEAAELLESVDEGAKILGDPTAHRILVHFKKGGDEAALLAAAKSGTLDVDLVETALGLHHLARGDKPGGVKLLRQVVGRGDWPSAAPLVAEIQLKRLGEKAPKPRKG